MSFASTSGLTPAEWYWRVMGRFCWYCKQGGLSALHICGPYPKPKEEK